MSHQAQIDSILDSLDKAVPPSANMRDRRRLTIRHLATVLAQGGSVNVALGKDRPDGVLGLATWYNKSKPYHANYAVMGSVEAIRLILHDVYAEELEAAERESYKQEQAEQRKKRQEIIGTFMDKATDTLARMETVGQKGYSVATMVNSALNQNRTEFEDNAEAMERKLWEMIPFSILAPDETQMVEDGRPVLDVLKVYFRRVGSE